MELYLHRHGQTYGNVKQYFNGCHDDPLTPFGIEELKAMDHHPDVKKVYVSHLSRAKDSAAILFPNAEQIVVPGLAEMNLGDFEMRSKKNLEADPVYQHWMNEDNWEFVCPNGQSVHQYVDQVEKAVSDIVDEELKKGTKEVRIMAHGGTIMAARTAFLYPRANYFTWWHVAVNGMPWHFHIDDATWSQRHEFTVVEASEVKTWEGVDD